MLNGMSVREPARHALYARLEDVLGPEHADTLMTHLPQHQSDQVATKSGIGVLKSDIAMLRSDMADFKAEVRADIKEVRADIKELSGVVRDQRKFYVGTVVGSMTALTAIFSLVVGLLN
jgi:hypothetical protein